MGIYLDVPSLKLCVNNHFHSMRKNKSIPYIFFFSAGEQCIETKHSPVTADMTTAGYIITSQPLGV